MLNLLFLTTILFSSPLYAQMIGLLNTAPKPRQYIAGAYARSVSDTTYNDGGHKFFGTSTNYKIIKGYTYADGVNVIGSYTESPPIPLYSKGIDFYVAHYNWPSDRADCTIRFYDVNSNYLGKFIYKKTSDSWSRTTSYTDIQFYNSVGTIILTISAVDLAGTSYGNGGMLQSISFADPTKITMKPHSYIASNGYTNIDHSYTVAHPFGNATYMTLSVEKIVSTYSASGAAMLRVGGYFSILPPR